MGRYYSGDIDGKFWFAVQSSDAADRFGVTGQVPDHLDYSFDQEDKQGVEDELKRIEQSLGEQLQMMNDFFDTNYSYSDDMLIGKGIDVSKLSDYADYQLGKKILDCLNEQGYCGFIAEL
jgi:hypothetical protein